MKNYVKSFMGEDGNLQLLYSALLTATFVLTILGNCMFIRKCSNAENILLLYEFRHDMRFTVRFTFKTAVTRFLTYENVYSNL